jgi:hypothetical protein
MKKVYQAEQCKEHTMWVDRLQERREDKDD